MYGIDFGTSNTVVTRREAGVTRVLDLGEGGVIPSLLYFEAGHRPSVGHEAMAEYTAALGRFRGAGNLYTRFRFFQAIKLALKDPLFEGTRLFGERVPVEELAAIFLREVKRRADEASAEPSDCSPAQRRADEDRLVLGRPVVLSPDPVTDKVLEDRFRRAAQLAGFSEVDFVFEPVAASVNFMDRPGQTVLVFDFGGGTLDICVARTRDGGMETLASAGRDLGGYLLNEDISRSRIVRHFGAGGKFRTMTGRELEMPVWITNQVASFYALPLADIQRTRSTVKDLVYDARREDKAKLRGLLEFLDRNLAFSLFDAIDAAKIGLSTAEAARISFEVPPHLAFSEALSRQDFETLVAPRLASARDLVLEALAKAGLEAREVDRVVWVGGSSRIPAFAAMLEGLFPGRVEEGEVFTSIASGLLEAREKGLQVP